jgi:predicted acetyltransferase
VGVDDSHAVAKPLPLAPARKGEGRDPHRAFRKHSFDIARQMNIASRPLIRLKVPTLDDLDGYADALKRGWSPTTMEDISQSELKKVEAGKKEYLAQLLAQGGEITLPDGAKAPRLPQKLFFIDDGDFCGRINLRYVPGTTDLPRHVSGHIGYTVVYWKAGQGYATEALRQLLPHARAVGLPFVTITCNLDNHASRRVIEKNGGVLMGEVEDNFVKGLRKLVWRVELA